VDKDDQIALLQTVIAGMVEAAGGEVRVSRASLEEPPEVEMGDDPDTGDWIYRLAQGDGR